MGYLFPYVSTLVTFDSNYWGVIFVSSNEHDDLILNYAFLLIFLLFLFCNQFEKFLNNPIYSKCTLEWLFGFRWKLVWLVMKYPGTAISRWQHRSCTTRYTTEIYLLHTLSLTLQMFNFVDFVTKQQEKSCKKFQSSMLTIWEQKYNQSNKFSQSSASSLRTSKPCHWLKALHVCNVFLHSVTV